MKPRQALIDLSFLHGAFFGVLPGALSGPMSVVLFGALLLAGCQSTAPPPEDEALLSVGNAYQAYQRGDCAAVRGLTDPASLESWAFDEKRHSMRLLRGFCLEQEGDPDGARDVYRRLLIEASTSFAAKDAAERIRVLAKIEAGRDFLAIAEAARERVENAQPGRTPVDRVPAEFPPMALASRIDGYVVVDFGITEVGTTEDPVVVDSSPPLLFDASALRAIRRWQYLREPDSEADDRHVIRISFEADAPEATTHEVETISAESPSAAEDGRPREKSRVDAESIFRQIGASNP